MKILRYATSDGAAWGILENDWVYAVEGDVYSGEFGKGAAVGGLESMALLAPCEPKEIVSIGANYESRCKENNLKIPETPGEGDKFYIAPEALVGPGAPLLIPRHEPRVDYSGELAIVMGRECDHASESEALDCVLGYSILHNAWAKGKTPDEIDWPKKGIRAYATFCPVGPCIETEIDPMNVAWETRVNGEVRQKANTSEMLFNIGQMVASVSEDYKLQPGDVIQTGTACGVGPMSPGDVIEIAFEGIGVLRNLAVDGGEMRPIRLEKVSYGGRN